MSEDTFRWVITGAVAISALCIFIMAVTAFVMYRVVSRLQVKTTRAGQIADNAKDISDVARDQAHRFAGVGRDIADRAMAKAAKVDAAVDDTVEQVHNAGANIKEAALKPVREANGVIAGLKAAVSTYAQGARRPGVERIAQDEEMFI